MENSSQKIKNILKENNLWAKKSYGQNFLVSEGIIDQITEAAELSAEDVVLEIGPGLGILTEKLAQKAKLVLAIEKDQKLVDYLRKKFKHCNNVKIIHADILTYNFIALKTHSYKVVANLPYNITSPAIRKFLEAENPPLLMILMVQKEVAERICAKAGSSERGILTVMVEFYSQVEIIDFISRDNFWPIPSVDSAIIKIQVTDSYLKLLKKVTCGYQQPKVTSGTHDVTLSNSEQSEFNNYVSLFFRIVRAGFSAKRRQIHNSLAGSLRLSKGDVLAILKEADIDPDLRAEDLKLLDWLNLYDKIKKRI